MPVTINGTTGLSGVDGSASTPAIQGNDTNTGVFFPAADTVAVATGGSERVRVDSSGNVGVGTSSPSVRLQVTSGSTGTLAIQSTGTSGQYPTSGAGMEFVAGSGSAQDSIISYNRTSSSWRDLYLQANALVFGTTGTERMRIDSSGRVTTPAQPAFKAHASGATINNGDIMPLNTTSYNIGNCYNTSNYRFTAPVAGVYLFGGMARIDGSWAYFHLMSYVNGVLNNQSSELPGLTSTPTTGGPAFAAGAIFYARYLNAGDYISFSMNSTSGPFYLHQQTYLTGYLLG